jgi:hypothetical protein
MNDHIRVLRVLIYESFDRYGVVLLECPSTVIILEPIFL